MAIPSEETAVTDTKGQPAHELCIMHIFPVLWAPLSARSRKRLFHSDTEKFSTRIQRSTVFFFLVNPSDAPE